MPPTTQIFVTVDELRTYNKNSKELVLQSSIEIIQGFQLDRAKNHEIIFWGQEPQTEYGKLLDQSLELSQSELYTWVTGHVRRMIVILGFVDLKKVCGFKDQSGFIAWVTQLFSRKSGDEIDSFSKFIEAQVELKQLVALMDSSLDSLVACKTQLEGISNQIDVVGDVTEAYMVAALFLSDYTKKQQDKDKMQFSKLFFERSTALTQTLVQIRNSDEVRRVRVEQPLSMIEQIQTTALNELPKWIQTVLTLRTVLAKRKATLTEIDELKSQKQDMITRLNVV